MRRSIRSRILWPFLSLALISTLVTGIAAISLVASRVRLERSQRLEEIAEVLSQTSFPAHPEVLRNLRRITGCQLVVYGSNGCEGSTLGNELPQDLATRPSTTIHVLSQDHQIIRSRMLEGRPRSVILLAPLELMHVGWSEIAGGMFLPSVLSALTVAAISGWIANSITLRIREVQRQLTNIAANPKRAISETARKDELADLQESARELVDRLTTFERQIVRTERLRLMAQVSGGLAHSLRKAVTGARLALQLHRKRCHQDTAGEELEVAMLQLRWVEERTQGILSLGSAADHRPIEGSLREALRELERLLAPICAHRGVTFRLIDELPESDATLRDSRQMRAALMNLAMNGIEASPAGGEVRIHTYATPERFVVDVIDPGAGPPSALSDVLGEPFVTGRQEGIGLGLTLAKEAAAQQGGELTWRRVEEATIFTMCWPKSERQTRVDDGSNQMGQAPSEPHAFVAAMESA